MAEKVKITLDGREVEVDAGKNVLQCILDAGLILPHFCYHEALGSLGACRLCAAMVAPAADKPGRLDMTCMVRAAEGMVVTVNDAYAKKFRKGVIEDLMLNHPHDCPVCDEGGECMLQDMTVLSEHQHRRTRFTKRTWNNQYLGPFIHHEMNRCITCYRCVRYYRDYALGEDLGVFGSRDRVYFGRVQEGALESEFAGNLLDVCPTGVFTNKSFRAMYSRPWDLQTTKSVCVNCSVGCNVLPGFRHSLLRRIKPLGVETVNRHFMCDRGRFGGEFVNSELRLHEGRVDGVAASAEAALQSAVSRLKALASSFQPGEVIGFGSERATLEANGGLALLVGALGGKVCNFTAAADRETVRYAATATTSAGASGAFAVPTLTQMEQADFVLVLGGDVTGEAPMLDLSIRQAVRAGAPLYIVSPRAGTLDKHARASFRIHPGAEHAFVGQLADTLNNPDAVEPTLQAAARALAAAKRPLIVCSTLHGSLPLAQAAHAMAAHLHSAERPCSLAYWFAGANTVGLGLMRNDADPATVREQLAAGKIKLAIVLERDLVSEDAEFAALLKKCEMVIAIDSIANPTTAAASIVLPAVTHYQAFGTLINYEGRGQHFDGLPIPGAITMAPSEVLLHLLQEAGLAEKITASEFNDLYAVAPESSVALDALRSGDGGIRVIGDGTLSTPGLPSAQEPANGSLHRWHVHHTFGSEELSAISPGVAQLAPAAYIELHPEDAAARQFAEGATIDLQSEFGPGAAGTLRMNAGLARHTLAVPALRLRPEVALPPPGDGNAARIEPALAAAGVASVAALETPAGSAR